MKILIAGDWLFPMYEKAFADSLTVLGHEVFEFSWSSYYKSLLGRFESKYCVVGPLTQKFNVDLLSHVATRMPAVVLLWRGTNILPSTLKKIKKLGNIKIASYNHDDFSGPGLGAPVPWHHKRLWRLFIECAPLIDFHFVKRGSNISHLAELGANNSQIMQMWFDPKIHRPVEIGVSEQGRFETDVVFVGHYEPDGREKSIKALVDAGIKTKIWGGHYWSRPVLGDLYDRLAPIEPAEGDDYAKALCGAKICLCFLSKLNRDTYTRRCFEIPACGRVMLAERTGELLRLFKEDEEACFFSSNEELVEKVRWLLENSDVRERIARAGLKRVWDDGHDVMSRVRQFLEAFDERSF
jgi:spore maturation protein CgeB